ncbi:hypothetical protein BSZ14_05175 [Sphingomonas sp. Sph1(2015)]|jgi:hypothetical protein|uniref:hypothetical protein n=1 Tax=Sphingomonas sp. Sph1(2015) TaxID=1628084 RepID=UPI000975E788|nr:hypothetical protein [Sphingomonas sp. Sph1(2015)]OMJ32997.1 hypothetical protein BSZ14_05175 [Sphingomonas sp. Sph1(2015)]
MMKVRALLLCLACAGAWPQSAWAQGDDNVGPSLAPALALKLFDDACWHRYPQDGWAGAVKVGRSTPYNLKPRIEDEDSANFSSGTTTLYTGEKLPDEYARCEVVLNAGAMTDADVIAAVETIVGMKAHRVPAPKDATILDPIATFATQAGGHPVKVAILKIEDHPTDAEPNFQIELEAR